MVRHQPTSLHLQVAHISLKEVTLMSIHQAWGGGLTLPTSTLKRQRFRAKKYLFLEKYSPNIFTQFLMTRSSYSFESCNWFSMFPLTMWQDALWCILSVVSSNKCFNLTSCLCRRRGWRKLSLKFLFPFSRSQFCPLGC